MVRSILRICVCHFQNLESILGIADSSRARRTHLDFSKTNSAEAISQQIFVAELSCPSWQYCSETHKIKSHSTRSSNPVERKSLVIF